MKSFFKALLFILVAIAAIALPAKEKKYDENDIKRILYLKKTDSSSPVRYVILEKIHSDKQLECTYLGTQQTLTVMPKNVIPMIFYADSSNFMITQYALYAMFSHQSPNLALGLAKINNDNTGRVNTLSSFAASLQSLQNNLQAIRKNYPPNSNEQANALADLISNDKTLSLVKQAATSNDWFLAITLFDNYKEDILKLYTRYFSSMPDIIKDAQIAYAECEKELLLNFSNKMQQPNMRRTLFLQLYPQARSLWSQPAPTNYNQLKNIYIRSMRSYHNLDKISRLFKPQDWGSAMLDVLLLLEGSPGVADLEKEFDDEMRRLVRHARRP